MTVMYMAPRIPKALWSQHGPMPVTRKKGLVKEQAAIGMFHHNPRSIELDKDTDTKIATLTFWHEAAHVALYDSGVEQFLSHKQIEGVCDAMGAFLGGMMLAGCLTVRAPQ